MSRNKTVYLAGPITGLTYSETINWREIATKEFKFCGIDAYSPMRNKGYLDNGKPIDPVQTRDLSKILSTNKAIVSRDYNDVSNSDCLLVNLLGATKVTIGTVAEMAWAHQLRKPIVCTIEQDGTNIHEHAFIQEFINFRVNNLADAIRTCCHILLSYN